MTQIINRFTRKVITEGDIPLRELVLQYVGNARLRGNDADLRGADLSSAYLRSANLSSAYLRSANLSSAYLPSFQITPKGFPLYGFKKLNNGTVATLLIPAEAERTASLVGRKCRAEWAIVIEGSGVSTHDNKTQYIKGEKVMPDWYDPDIRIECTKGIHFFLTPEEAKDY